MDADALKVLERKLTEATGGDRLLDEAVYEALIGPVTWALVSDAGNMNPPGYTLSLDAAVALVECVLPGHCLQTTKYAWGGNQNWGAKVFDPRREGRSNGGAFGATPALALCLALIRALLSEKGGT